MSVRIEMEQYLAAASGRVNVSVDEIMDRAGNSGGDCDESGAAALRLGALSGTVGFVGLVLLLAVTVPRQKKQTGNRPPIAKQFRRRIDRPASEGSRCPTRPTW